MDNGIVFDIKKFSVHDGPGIRTTVFLKGCDLQCWWCHNPESQRTAPELLLRPNLCIGCRACVSECPQCAITWDTHRLITDREKCVCCGRCVSVCYADAREIVGREMTIDQVMAEIMRDAPFYDQSAGGVTFSGGEPLLQPDFLLGLLQACKAQGINTAVDTCGHVPTESLDRVGEYVDLFLYDLKLIDSERHRRVTGVPNTRVLANLRHLDQTGARVIVRIPIIPGINDDTDNIGQTAQFIRALPSVERVDLLAYHQVGLDKYERLGRISPMPQTAAPDPADLDQIKRTLQGYGLDVTVGG